MSNIFDGGCTEQEVKDYEMRHGELTIEQRECAMCNHHEACFLQQQKELITPLKFELLPCGRM